MVRREAHSGIYLLPNLLTTASLFAAFYSIVASLKGQYESAIIAIFIGTIADALDGRIARLTHTQTAFGAQFDSLSDMVTFGVAPPLLLYSLSLQILGKVGWLVAFVYTAAVAIRLAKFNINLSVEDKHYFRGLPCPPAAAFVASFVWLCIQGQHSYPLLAAVLSVILAVLMVSNLPYNSFKNIDFKGKVPLSYLLVSSFILVAIAASPAIILFLFSTIYILSGPVKFILRRKRF